MTRATLETILNSHIKRNNYLQLTFEVTLDNDMKYKAREEGNVRNTNQEVFFYDSSSAVARGGAGGARAPPVFFLKSKNRPV